MHVENPCGILTILEWTSSDLHTHTHTHGKYNNEWIAVYKMKYRSQNIINLFFFIVSYQ